MLTVGTRLEFEANMCTCIGTVYHFYVEQAFVTSTELCASVEAIPCNKT